MNSIKPRYSCIFIDRFCPRSCSYCLAREVRGKGNVLNVEQWEQALTILEEQGVVFHLILGNELLTYSEPVNFVKMLKKFWGRYAIYSTFPEPWTRKHLDNILNEGLYNISGGVDVWPGLKTGDTSVDNKADRVLNYLLYCKEKGVPDVQATVTIHRFNYDKLEPLLDLCTEKGIWNGLSMIEYSSDGKHDFYKTKEAMKNWLIPHDERNKFYDAMFSLAAQIRTGRWMVQVPPEYFEELAVREIQEQSWHCTLPLLIHLEEDGGLRGCSYRGPIKKDYSVFDFNNGTLTMEEYIQLQRESANECPGCSGNGGAWSYWWMAEHFQKGDVNTGDQVFQIHVTGNDFNKTIKK